MKWTYHWNENFVGGKSKFQSSSAFVAFIHQFVKSVNSEYILCFFRGPLASPIFTFQPCIFSPGICRACNWSDSAELSCSPPSQIYTWRKDELILYVIINHGGVEECSVLTVQKIIKSSSKHLQKGHVGINFNLLSIHP